MSYNKQDSDLDSDQKMVISSMRKFLENSERDAHTIEQLVEIEKNTNSEGKQKINTLISDFKRISYSSNWVEFEILFEKSHSSFYEKLCIRFPMLSNKERKLCALLRLNLNSKEIALFTFQSDEALKKARLRLRQKFAISREVNLTTFLQNI